MGKIVSPKITALSFGILVVCFAIAFYVMAWQEPSQAPPGGNVPAPINVGSTGQSKAGGLILNTGGATNGLIIDKGNLCLGTDCRSSWPTAIPSGMIAMFDTSCPSGWTRFAVLDSRFPLGAATYGSTGGSITHTHSTTVTGPASWQYGTSYGYFMLASPGTYTSTSGGDYPPYTTVIWCKKN